MAGEGRGLASGRKAAPGREKLLSAAERLFAERGFDAVSIKELALAAGLTIGALYHHFPSKEAIYCETVQRAIASLPQGSLEGLRRPEDRLQGLIAGFSAAIVAPSDAAALLRRELLEPHLETPLTELDVFKPNLAEFGALLQQLSPGANIELAIAAVVSLSFGLTSLGGLRAVAPSMASLQRDPDALAQIITDMVLRSF